MIPSDRDERAQLKKAKEAVFAPIRAPTTVPKNLRARAKMAPQRSNGSPCISNCAAAELNIDPTLAPIFAKLDAAHQNWHHHPSRGSGDAGKS